MTSAKAKKARVQTTWFLPKLYNTIEFEKALLRQGLFLSSCQQSNIRVGTAHPTSSPILFLRESFQCLFVDFFVCGQDGEFFAGVVFQ